MKAFFRKLKAVIERFQIRFQILFFKKIINGRHAWAVFDANKIPGFGLNLQRTYFPIYYGENQVKDTFSKEVKAIFINLFDVDFFKKFEPLILKELSQIVEIPKNEVNPLLPYLDNYFFGVLDAAVLSAILQTYQPKKLIEIGSGISTRYMHHFKKKYQLSTHLTCVDPNPRVNINQVADHILTLTLEEAMHSHKLSLKSGDILFMDGSHYVFQGNDTLTFFFKLLPSLPSGVIIHIHDIYLPDDYEEQVSCQLWSEQYLLAAMMLNGLTDYQVIYPTYYQSKHSSALIKVLGELNDTLSGLHFEKMKNHLNGYSFWMIKK